MTYEKLLSLIPDHTRIVAAITAVSNAGEGSVEIQMDKLELGQVARRLQLHAVNVGGSMWSVHDRYELVFRYMEVSVTLYALVPKR